MKIDLTKLKMYSWFEDEEGNVYKNEPSNVLDKPYYTYHVVSPMTYSEPVVAYTYHPSHLHENNSFYHAMLCFGWFRRFMYKRMCKHPQKYDKTFRPIFTGQVHMGRWAEELILAMANSGDYSLSESIYICANACERCANALAYKYLNGKDGYAEYSDEWKRCNTECAFCKEGERE